MRAPVSSSLLLAGLLLPGAALAQGAPKAAPQPIPDRPEKLHFPALKFTPPQRAAYRHQLPDGVVVYLAPSHELPLVDVELAFKGGRYLDPVGKEGLARATAAMMRRGGTADTKATDFDAQVGFLATRMGVRAGDYQVTATMNTLKKNLDASFDLFFQMLKRPAFAQARLDLYESEVLEGLEQRNDDADAILQREWTALVYGRDSFKGRLTTKASLMGLTAADLKAFHDRWITPGNLVIGVSGDFDPAAMTRRLEAALAGWKKGAVPPDPTPPAHVLRPGVYWIQKDIPQGKVILGMRGIRRHDPDFFPLMIMSRILGSGGFTSRIMNRVRTEEGLAYSAGAYLIPGLYFPGEFRAFFQSKSRTVALAIKIIFEEIARIRREPVSPRELQLAKDSIIESFPSQFGSTQQVVSTFVKDELTGRPRDYWDTYRAKVKAVTAADVLRVAKAHLDSKKMAVLVVGRWADIARGDLRKRARMADFFDGEATELPLRDPLTLEPIK